MLDAARFAEGVGGACTWSGILAWLIVEVPVDRRGSAIGWALAAGIGGALFGPVIGTLAHGLGRGAVFSAVVVITLPLAVAVQVLPRRRPRRRRCRARRCYDSSCGRGSRSACG